MLKLRVCCDAIVCSLVQVLNSDQLGEQRYAELKKICCLDKEKLKQT